MMKREERDEGKRDKRNIMKRKHHRSLSKIRIWNEMMLTDLGCDIRHTTWVKLPRRDTLSIDWHCDTSDTGSTSLFNRFYLWLNRYRTDAHGSRLHNNSNGRESVAWFCTADGRTCQTCPSPANVLTIVETSREEQPSMANTARGCLTSIYIYIYIGHTLLLKPCLQSIARHYPKHMTTPKELVRKKTDNELDEDRQDICKTVASIPNISYLLLVPSHMTRGYSIFSIKILQKCKIESIKC